MNRLFAAAALVLLSASAAQAVPVEWTVDAVNGTTTELPKVGVVLTVPCKGDVCTTMTAKLGEISLPPKILKDKVQFELAVADPPTANRKFLLVVDHESKFLTLNDEGAPPPPAAPKGNRPGGADQPSDKDKVRVLAQLSQHCTLDSKFDAYDRDNNLARVAVLPNGEFLSRMTKDFDQDDTLQVIVRVHPDLKPFLHVSRQSEFGPVGELSILGQATNIGAIVRQAKTLDELVAKPCVSHVVYLRDFAPGKGVVQISASAGGEETVLGTFEFSVHRLYDGPASKHPSSRRASRPSRARASP